MVSASVSLSFHFLSAGRSLELKNIQKFSQPLKPALPLCHFPALHFAGGEATSYTFLPRKDDFQPNSPFTCSTPLPNVIKVSEATIPTVVDSLLKKPSTSADSVEESGEKGGAEEKFLEVESDDVNEANFGGLSDAVEMDGLDEDLKEKGVPSVMRCFDQAKIYVKSGDGGNGVVAFLREKFVPYGGPSGGDGGRGGDIYAEVDGSMNSLLPFRSRVHFRAGRGRHGQGKKQSGAKGEDVVVKVPPGTLIRESGKCGVEGKLLLELLKPGQRALLISGGRGGKGNASFKSGARKVPKIAENGEAGIEMWLSLELKLVADVGIIGAPNAGKSTLLSSITAAKPLIANYPFTTLLPNLGVVSLDYENTMVVADLPGLLDGAHRGFGLGHEFLRHTERCVVLVHVVDGSSQQPDYEFDAVRLELELFSPRLSKKPYMVVFNKMDLPEAYEKWDSFKNYLQNRGIEPLSISAMYKQGTNDVVFAANALLQKEMAKKAVEEESEHSGTINIVANAIDKHHRSPMTDFEVFHNRGSNKWHVVGSGIERFVQMTNWRLQESLFYEDGRYTESLKRFQHALEACGVNKALQNDGIREGDTVIVGEMEMIWNDKKEQPATAKRVSGYVRWPHFG